MNRAFEQCKESNALGFTHALLLTSDFSDDEIMELLMRGFLLERYKVGIDDWANKSGRIVCWWMPRIKINGKMEQIPLDIIWDDDFDYKSIRNDKTLH